MKEFLLLLTLLLVLGFIACAKKVNQVQKTPKISSSEKVEKLAKERYQSDYKIVYNKSKTVACITKSFKIRPSDIFPTLSFILYNPETEKTFFKETIPRASGKWINEEEFEVITILGRVGRSATLKKKQGFVFNIKSGKKRRL